MEQNVPRNKDSQDNRVKSHERFQDIYEKGRSYVDRYGVFYVLPSATGRNQLGTAVGKRLGHAVLRNQVKRRMREVFRKEQAGLKGKNAIVWVARHRLAHAPYGGYQEVFRRLATNFAADEGSAAVKPSETLHVAGDGKNLSTKVEGNTLSVNLKKDLAVDSVTAGGTKLSSDGVTIAGGPSMTKDGLDAGSKKITNVAAGTEETDGANYGQLKGVENRVEENTRNINQVNGRLSNLDSRLNKVGAGAAALAALHPQDFNPDEKWDFALGFGNYRDANAMAVGAFYRPDARTMFSVAGNFGNGENMVNAGISVKLGKNSPYAGMDRQAMIHRLASQDRELEAQNQRIAKLEQLVAQLMAK